LLTGVANVANNVTLHPYSKSFCDAEIAITPVTNLSVAETSCCEAESEKKNFQFREFSENLFKLRQRVSRKVKKTKKKEKNAARKERKATKTLAIVLGNITYHLQVLTFINYIFRSNEIKS
jgi:hypothetical protein